MQCFLSLSLLLLNVLATLARRFEEPPISSPSRIARTRFTIRGTKMIMSQTFDEAQVVDVYNLRFSWLDPYEWNDRASEGRAYEYACWVSKGSQQKTLTHRVMDAGFQGYAEPLRFPENFEASVQCKVRPRNSAGLYGDWRYTEAVRVDKLPIYLQGFGDLDVRGIPNKRLLEILRSKA